MKTTKIQWCHSTVNPVMGCSGCELWHAGSSLVDDITCILSTKTNLDASEVKTEVARLIDGRPLSEVYRDRTQIEAGLAAATGIPTNNLIADSIRSSAKCYAGLCGTMRAGHKGYADQFEIPKAYPGRVAAAANWNANPVDSSKPWLDGLPRLIFVSDMGDALCEGIPFDYLRHEIVDAVLSPKGQRHVWLWLTKRPARMVEFGSYLLEQGIKWPDNLVPMTTVTSRNTVGRVAELLKVPSKCRGISAEPLFGPVKLDLNGVDWLIVGGGSDVLASPFQVEWALDLQVQCQAAGTAFFLKQLGRSPFYQHKPLRLHNKHGGDWAEWPEASWRIRELPQAFRHLAG